MAAAASPEAAYFHTRAWARIVLASFPQLRDRSIWFDTPSGPALLPLFAWSRLGGLLTTLHSSFPFMYGGPVGPGGSEAGAILRHLSIHGSRLASLRLQGNPFARSREVGIDPSGMQVPGLSIRGEQTQMMAVPGTEDEYWESVLEARRRNDIRRLMRKGVVVEASTDSSDLETVYGFYLDSFRRWGGRPAMVYPLAFYRNLIAMGGAEALFLVARFEGRLLGGSFFACWNRRTHYLAAYFDHDARALSPLALIQVEAIRRSIHGGCLVHDFLPSGGHQSVEAFKEGLGGRRTSFPVYERTGLVHRVAGWLRR